MRKLTQEEFIKKCKDVHADKYDYSKVQYVNNNEKVIIVCKEHGDFLITAKSYLKGRGCLKCGLIKLGNKLRYTTEEFIEKAKEIHGDRYDYSKVQYKGAHTKVIIKCNTCGEYHNQKPNSHLSGHGCLCVSQAAPNKQSDIIERFIKVHGDKYDYSKVQYKNNKDKIEIICNEHGSFEQSTQCHLRSKGCPKCVAIKVGDMFRYTTEEFIEKAKEIHCDRYDYSKVKYFNAETKIKILCKSCNKEFKQRPSNHLNGRGCSKCTSSKGEIFIINYLSKNNIEFIHQKKFEDCKNILQLRFDFYIPAKNICIEYDGIQHFQSVKHFGGEEAFNIRKNIDKIKTNYCIEKGIKLVRIKYTMLESEIICVLASIININL